MLFWIVYLCILQLITFALINKKLIIKIQLKLVKIGIKSISYITACDIMTNHFDWFLLKAQEMSIPFCRLKTKVLDKLVEQIKIQSPVESVRVLI